MDWEKAQRDYDAGIVRALAKQEPYSKQPWARMALFTAARAIDRGRLLTDAEKMENLAAAFEVEGGHEVAAMIRGSRTSNACKRPTSNT